MGLKASSVQSTSMTVSAGLIRNPKATIIAHRPYGGTLLFHSNSPLVSFKLFCLGCFSAVIAGRQEDLAIFLHRNVNLVNRKETYQSAFCVESSRVLLFGGMAPRFL
jgi:hypothetical protein